MSDKADKKRPLERNDAFADGGAAESVIAGMVGGGYYNQHSAPQMASIDFVLPWLDAAIASMHLSEAWPTTIGLADFGCSEGGNSIAVMQRLVSVFRKRSSRPIQTHHIDLPTNDYRELFKNLRPDGGSVFEAAETYSAAVGGSMYDQLLPPRSIHLATTFNSIAYLSRRPVDRLANYVSANGPSARRGIGEVTQEERDAFADQAEADMESFLIARAAELVPGGKLLVQNFGCGEVFRECDGNCDVLNDALLEIVDAGIIDREGYEAFYLPVYYRTLDELTAPLTTPNSALARSFRLERAESSEVPVPFVEQFNSTGDADRFGRDYIEYIRAFSEPMLRVSFAEHVDLDRLVSEVFERTERLIRNHPDRYEYHYIGIAALLTLCDGA